MSPRIVYVTCGVLIFIASTLASAQAQTTVVNTVVSVGDAQILQANIVASNGVIHIVDSIIIPRDVRQRARQILRSRLSSNSSELRTITPPSTNPRMDIMGKESCVHSAK